MSEKDKEEKVVDLFRYRMEKNLKNPAYDGLSDMSEEDREEYDDWLNFLETNVDDFCRSFHFWHHESDLIYHMYRGLSEAENTAQEKRLKNGGLEIMGEDTSGFLYAKHKLANMIKRNGLYDKALQQLQEVYQFDKSDDLYARYDIMALYALLQRYDEAKAFYQSDKSFENSVYFLVPLFVLSLLADDIEATDQYVEKLRKLCPDFATLNENEKFPLARVMRCSDFSDDYEPEFVEEESHLYLALGKLAPLLMMASGYIYSYLTPMESRR